MVVLYSWVSLCCIHVLGMYCGECVNVDRCVYVCVCVSEHTHVSMCMHVCTEGVFVQIQSGADKERSLLGTVETGLCCRLTLGLCISHEWS